MIRQFGKPGLEGMPEAKMPRVEQTRANETSWYRRILVEVGLAACVHELRTTSGFLIDESWFAMTNTRR